MGSRSFASVVMGSDGAKKPNIRRVNLTPSQDLNLTLFSTFLFGESIDLGTLKAMPNLLKDAGIMFDTDNDIIWKFEDLSYVNVCLLTESKTKINDNIIIDYDNGKHVTIGIIEDACFINPFDEGFDADDEMDMETDQESSDDESGSEGVSDTWDVNSMVDKTKEVEEGEILPEAGDGGLSPVKEFEESDSKKSPPVLVVEESSIQNSDVISPSPSIDLKKSANPNGSAIDSGEASHASSTPEILKTVTIGNEVGFQVNVADPVLCEENGEWKILHARLVELDAIVESRAITVSKSIEVRDGKVKLLDLDRSRKMDLKQRSRIK
ncbi:hypothetical protein L2E82_48439 [Cichorium intybus]|uniref:Uncharacterized protein n=1 Tax=Cichorium intybus TaxID=13427 RepID=A0ACB8YZM7_CICIN|nr:hypothetical protein L2E82_48439 [Cichorium intybus]